MTVSREVTSVRSDRVTAVRALHRRLKGLPRALFVNSTIALEGVVRFLMTLPRAELERCTFGCYDWDPFARVLSFPVLMVRQNVEGMLEEAFPCHGALLHYRSGTWRFEAR